MLLVLQVDKNIKWLGLLFLFLNIMQVLVILLLSSLIPEIVIQLMYVVLKKVVFTNLKRMQIEYIR